VFAHFLECRHEIGDLIGVQRKQPIHVSFLNLRTPQLNGQIVFPLCHILILLGIF